MPHEDRLRYPTHNPRSKPLLTEQSHRCGRRAFVFGGELVISAVGEVPAALSASDSAEQITAFNKRLAH
ncbi:hypothetical protein JZ751_012540 [Albula glossodonta]|uniref:Uncharacterized protein n=1 Tax=Albula glossodonta TaxID=121402 RepID=A0A8T2NY48_9TELE|nr:hypothetical protein JZ751_012540 [Albula glossodonta]